MYEAVMYFYYLSDKVSRQLNVISNKMVFHITDQIYIHEARDVTRMFNLFPFEFILIPLQIIKIVHTHLVSDPTKINTYVKEYVCIPGYVIYIQMLKLLICLQYKIEEKS